MLARYLRPQVLERVHENLVLQRQQQQREDGEENAAHGQEVYPKHSMPVVRAQNIITPWPRCVVRYCSFCRRSAAASSVSSFLAKQKRITR